MKDCPFCCYVENNKHFFGVHKEISERVLWETKHFYVAPSVGAFVKGYFLIITKKHYFNMGSSNNLHELNDLVHALKKHILTLYKSKSIVFEHGSVQDSSSGGASINHAHMHVVPTNDDLELEIKKTGILVPVKNIYNLLDYSNNPYIYYQNTQSYSYIIDILNPPSQYLRQILAKSLNVDDCWNWRIYPYKENIEQTIKDFENIRI